MSNTSTARPGQSLSARETEMLQMVALGNTDKEIAGIYGLAESTVKGHVYAARIKLEAKSRAHAVCIGLQRKLITGNTQ